MREVDGIVEYDFEEVRRGLADGSMILVDVREPAEWDAGHIPGSVHRPLSSFDPADLPAAGKDQAIVFACRSGGRTLRAIMACQMAGLPLRAHYRGSFMDWVARGGDVVTG